jgi:hypothetical protein
VTGHNPRVLISEKEHSGSTWPPGRSAGEQEQTALRAALATLNAGASRPYYDAAADRAAADRYVRQQHLMQGASSWRR